MKKVRNVAMMIAMMMCVTPVMSCSEAQTDGDNNQNQDEDKPAVVNPTVKKYTNPVLKPGTFDGQNITSLADPFVLKDDDGTYYMYVTGKGCHTFSSKDLVHWTYCGKAIPSYSWGKSAFWAPEAFKYKGKYYLHYSSCEVSNGPKRIGLAVSDSPKGPFVDVAKTPFYTHEKDKGCIDSHFLFDDDGSIYMYYSLAASENPADDTTGSLKNRSEIWVTAIKPDLSGPIENTALMLTKPEQSWEHDPTAATYWNEGATVLKHDGKYYLMFSANNYTKTVYAVGFATSDSPAGPFAKSDKNPVLTAANASGRVSGPGHNCVVESPDGKELYCVYHSHVDLVEKGSVRMINIDKLMFMPDGSLYVQGPSYNPKPMPSGCE
ncbi:MAG: family 43 glycosylhydrolase [Bacteroidales bacterium]|nr:family 43 glycosylhydrolase [Bacteroidales bacterium]